MKIKFILILFINSPLFSFCQNNTLLKIDGDSVLVNSGISFPYWLNTGQSIELINGISKISTLEFFNDTTGNLRFSKPITLVNNNLYTVPQGKVWKMESFTMTPSSNIGNNSNISTSIHLFEGLSINQVKTYTGTVPWGPTEKLLDTVPVGKIWKICSMGFSGASGVITINNTPYYNFQYAVNNIAFGTINETIWLKPGDILSYRNPANSCYYCNPVPYVISVIEYNAP